MTDRDALLRAICEAPDDDAPRLIYADWLDEHGDPRQAEFIRVQIELARAREDDQQTHLLKQREQDLWRELRKWRYAPPDWMSLYLGHFRRGFADQWQGDVTRFVIAADNTMRLGPIQTLRLFVDQVTGSGAKWAEGVANQPILAVPRRVEVSGTRLKDRWVERFLRTPYSSRWTHLTFSGNSLTDAVCNWLSVSPPGTSGCVIQLESLNISEFGREQVARALACRQASASPT
jgi:uncharacterized protein (TIGR02996 family)